MQARGDFTVQEVPARPSLYVCHVVVLSLGELHGGQPSSHFGAASRPLWKDRLVGDYTGILGPLAEGESFLEPSIGGLQCGRPDHRPGEEGWPPALHTYRTF